MNKLPKIVDLSTTDLKFTNTREFDFSAKKVFEMFSNPKYLAKWFGPKGFTNTFEIFEFWEGGDWIFVMHGPNGDDYQNSSVFLKIVENELIIWEHNCIPYFQAHFNIVKIEQSKTRVEFSLACYEKHVFDGIMTYAKEKNEENLDKLDNLLKEVYL